MSEDVRKAGEMQTERDREIVRLGDETRRARWGHWANVKSAQREELEAKNKQDLAMKMELELSNVV